MRPITLLLAGLFALAAGWLDPSRAAEGQGHDYHITKDNGPYMIYVASFRGDESERMAWDLVTELRRDFHLPAYLFSVSEERRKQQREELEERRKRYGDGVPLKRERIVDEYAVMVGNYKSFDAATESLKKMREKYEGKAPTSVDFSKMLMVVQPKGTVKSGDKSKLQGTIASINPLAHGWVMRNPLAPKEPIEKEKFDKEWVGLNRDEKYSLLKCSKKWTLVVKVFRAPSIIWGGSNPSIFQPTAVEQTQNMEKQLDILKKTGGFKGVAGQAHNLADILRSKALGYEAYVLHAQEYSLVCVGGFNKPDDPELLKLQRLLSGLKIGLVELENPPVLMEIPRP